MDYEDKTLTCQDCGQPFTFSADDQAFHAMKGFTNEPKRCATCRQQRRSGRDGGDGEGFREMHPVVCAECGNGYHGPIPAPRRPPGLLQRLLQQTAHRHRRTGKLVNTRNNNGEGDCRPLR